MKPPRPFHVVEGSPAPDGLAEKRRKRIVAMPKPAAMLQCRCGSRTMIEVKTGVMSRGLRPFAGTKQMACAVCMAAGRLVIVS